MGSKSSKSDKRAARTAASQQQLAEELFEQSSPIRELLFGRAEEFLSSPETALASSPAFAGFKAPLESNFARARERVIETTPEGGSLTSALAGLEGQKALGLAQGQGQIFENEIARAFGLGTGTTTQAQQGLGSAAATQASLASSQAQQKGAKGQALGTLGAAGLMVAFPPAAAAAGPAAVAAPAASDIRVKKNIRKIGEFKPGINLYMFDYIGGESGMVGVMAQEVEKVIPNAVIEIDGIKHVDYAGI